MSNIDPFFAWFSSEWMSAINKTVSDCVGDIFKNTLASSLISCVFVQLPPPPPPPEELRESRRNLANLEALKVPLPPPKDYEDPNMLADRMSRIAVKQQGFTDRTRSFSAGRLNNVDLSSSARPVPPGVPLPLHRQMSFQVYLPLAHVKALDEQSLSGSGDASTPIWLY